MAKLATSIPYSGSEYVESISSVIVPLAELVDANFNSFFVQSNSGYVASADGSLVTLGNTSDAAYTGTGNATGIATLKGVYAKLAATLSTSISGYVNPTASAYVADPASTLLVVNTDTAVSFGQKVNHFFIQNNTSQSVFVNLDATATQGSPQLLPNAVWEDDKPVTSIHYYSPVAVYVNGNLPGIAQKGWI